MQQDSLQARLLHQSRTKTGEEYSTNQALCINLHLLCTNHYQHQLPCNNLNLLHKHLLLPLQYRFLYHDQFYEDLTGLVEVK